jgi:hypothetical protein
MTVIIPAHNEGRVIGRLLERLVPGGSQENLDIVVVANGCTDDTVAVAESFGPPVRVLTTPKPSKQAALAAGDEAAKGFPRVYLDADVELGLADLRALGAALAKPEVAAAAPVRHLDLARSAWTVRWYYDVWQRLPAVERGLFGRGVIAVSEAGHERIAQLPPVLADDLAASLSFGAHERVIVPGAVVTVHAPRTFGDLMRRRVRVVTGVAQIEGSAQAPPSTERTSMRDLLVMTARNPLLAPKIAIFLGVTVLARRQGRHAARKRDYTTWLRDDSSRE